MSHFRRTLLFYLIIFCVFSTYIGYLSLRENANVKLIQRELHSFLYESSKSRKDNFLAMDDTLYDILVVNTTNCKIPDFSPYDPMAVPFVHKAEWVEDCPKISFHWTYRKGKSIIFNETAMSEDGYKFEDVSCCYKSVTRVEQSLEKYDITADDLIEYSDCKPINTTKTDIDTDEFIMIECSRKLLLNLVIYRGFHAIAQPHRSNATSEKIKFWKNIQHPKALNSDGVELLPNILILGTDTTSRLNFRRNMVQTTAFLEKLGAIEMKGYTKSGESTRPAFVTMYTGYYDEDLEGTCHLRSDGSYDKCPFIWQRFSEAKYLTAHSEDWPDLYAFNNGRSGFVHQSVDYDLRTLMNAAHDFGLPYPVNQFVRLSTQWCIGHQTNDEVMMDYTESVLDMVYEEKVPLFGLTWSDTYPHSMDHNVLQLLDGTYAQFLKRIEAKGYLQNTILIFLSDHGQRYGPLRETLLGWYEDKLPNFWIWLPQKYQQRFPEWQTALEANSRRLTSPYTLYWTLNYLVDHFSSTESVPAPPEVLKYAGNGTLLPRKFTGHTFLSKVPEQNECADVGVPDVFCACNPLKKVELSDPLLLKAGSEALEHLNKKLPSICAKLKIGRLTGGAKMEKLGKERGKEVYIIGLITDPGEMLIEAEIEFLRDTQQFVNSSSVQRANQINQNDIKCMKDKDFQLYCYCQKSNS